jgi:hypothetical protein
LLVCRTMTRPYISERGPRKRGPTAYARTKIDSINEDTTELVRWNSLAMVSRAGATIDEETGEMNVKDETRENS